jgi:drug/metabolite transporter (DMT)-like permease
MNRSMLAGITAAVLAAISWSLGYIVPFVIGKYTPFDFALVEFVFAGLLSAGLLWRKRAVVRLLTFNDWWVAGSLGLIGYACYFLAIMGSAIYAGPVVAPAFLGLVPVVLVIAGNLRRRTVSWRSLMLPLALATVGLVLVNGSSFTQSGTPQAQSLLLGIALALLAVIFWTVFGLLNQSALETRPHLDAGVWGTLIVAGASVAMLAFLPVGLSMGVFEIPRLGLGWDTAAPLLLWGAGLAIFSNLFGALAWTFASQRLPLALAAQLITIEPTSATILGLLVHRRWPSLPEVLGMALLLTGVVAAIGIFTRSSINAAQPAAA